MFTIGEKISINGNDAIVLIDTKDEVLIHMLKNTTKWIDKKSIEDNNIS